jgi:uncharacterized protein (DUF342 family)
VLAAHPRIQITQFANLKKAIDEPNQLFHIGAMKPLLELSYSADKLTGYACYNMSEDEFQNNDKTELMEIILAQAKNDGIVFGIDIEKATNNMKPLVKFVFASGQLPIRGEDATIQLYEIKDIKPEIYKNGNVNYYELSVINKVNKGDWVGERIEPTDGTPGKTIFGDIIPPVKGKQIKIPYDMKTIQAVIDDTGKKTSLFAKQQGAVIYEGSTITICNCLEISDTVSFETGNIDFDGFVDIKNSVDDNFSVVANKNIQIMGDLGVGGVDTIESREGCIYIRGGIAGKGKAKIICNGDFYAKFVSDCTIECTGSVNIGYYAMNANIKAKEVVFESLDSKIIGGNIEADVRVVTGEIGNRNEIVTRITILGFNRAAYKADYDSLKLLIEKIKEKIAFYKQEMAIYSSTVLTEEQSKKLYAIDDKYNEFKEKLVLLNNRLAKCRSYLQAKGEGEIHFNKCIYPRVVLTIKNEKLIINDKSTTPTSYYYSNNNLTES